MALPTRTLRHWLARPEPEAPASTSPVAPAPPALPPRKRPPRRPRFSFQVVLPETQLAGDTTGLSAFGCDLKLIATQDIGGRDENLLESVIVDDHENADLVVQAFTEAIDGREGFQAIVDQGTPYMAKATREALEALGAEHAPQVEGNPTDKATIERAFGTQVHRDDIRDRPSYFFAIVRRLHEDFFAERARRKAGQEQHQRRQAIEDEHTARQQARSESPATWLREALKALAAQWRPESRNLLFGGIGIGRRWMVDAITLLVARQGQLAARDIADGVFHRFATAFADRLGHDGLDAIWTLLDQQLPPRPEATDQSRCTQDFAAAILPSVGPKQRSAPEGALSNLPARPGGS